jgi:tetratricopeptide (TPR) repeat protein
MPDTTRALRPTLLTAAALATLAAAAWACGPDFKQMLLDRAATLRSHIVSDFVQDANRLVPAPDHKLPVQAHDADDSHDPERERAKAEAASLPDWQAYKIKAMRRAASGDEAYTLGSGLPAGLRLYTAAAVDFQQQGDGPCSERSITGDAYQAHAPRPPQASTVDLSPLTERFEAVLRLPPYLRRSRASWSAYALGRLMANQCRWPEATRWFQATRRLVQQGAPDPLHLAVASLGEEARVQWLAGHIDRAVALYAEQAARGSVRGNNSLRHIAPYLLRRPTLLAPWLKDPLVQKLVVRYALSELDAAVASETMYGTQTRSGTTPRSPAQAEPLPTSAAIAHLLDQLTSNHVNTHTRGLTVVEPDALAALAYNLGRSQQARPLAQIQDTALAHWVRAKLALRDGHTAEAAAQYAEAVKQISLRDHPLPAGHSFDTEEGGRGSLHDVLHSEHAFLTLSRGDFVQALHQLYGVGQVYWLDLAYLAERVLTVDELKAYVDTHVPAPPLPRTERQGKQTVAINPPDVAWPATNVAAQLRTLLARRLMRAQRYDEALPYFHASGDLRFADPAAREHAQDYARALRAAPQAWTSLGRAHQLYSAARLMREHGMDIVGFELGPDGAAVDGNLPLDTPEAKPAWLSTPAEARRVAQSGPLTRPLAPSASAATQAATVYPSGQTASSNPTSQATAATSTTASTTTGTTAPNQRYHYRPLAAQLAVQAAAALPPRSATYAAVMCQASGWLLSSHDQLGAWQVYEAYTRHGAYVNWAAHFGRDCPTPAFSDAAWFIAKTQWHTARHVARRHRALVYGAVSAITLSTCALTWLRLRQQRTRRAERLRNMMRP